MSLLDAYTGSAISAASKADHTDGSARAHSDVDSFDEDHGGLIMGLLIRTSAAIAIIGAVILIMGCVLAFVNVSMLALQAFPVASSSTFAIGDTTRSLTLNLVRSQLGHIIVFTLEILVAADVIETLAVPVHAQSFATLGKISIIVAVRTCLSFFLEKELEAVDEELRHEKAEQCNATASPPRYSPKFFPLLSSGGEGILAEVPMLEQSPSPMLLVTLGLFGAALVLHVAERFERPAPVAELVVLGAACGWCHHCGSIRLLLLCVGAAAAVAAAVSRRELAQWFSDAARAVLLVIAPDHHWELQHIVFWAAGCSFFAWAVATVAVVSGMQKSSEHLWLAILLVSLTFYAVNSLPVFGHTHGHHDEGVGLHHDEGAHHTSEKEETSVSKQKERTD